MEKKWTRMGRAGQEPSAHVHVAQKMGGHVSAGFGRSARRGPHGGWVESRA